MPFRLHTGDTAAFPPEFTPGRKKLEKNQPPPSAKSAEGRGCPVIVMGKGTYWGSTWEASTVLME